MQIDSIAERMFKAICFENGMFRRRPAAWRAVGQPNKLEMSVAQKPKSSGLAGKAKPKAKGSSRASMSPPKAGAKAKPNAGAAKRTKVRGGAKDGVVLLSGGNPQIAKGEGDAPVKAYIAAVPGWKRDIAKQLDALIVRNAPSARKAVKWNSPFYGIEGRGWFVSFHVFTHYVKVTFFNGTSLRPVPPGGTAKDARWIDIHENDLNEAQMAAWVKQAAAMPGWLA